MLLRNFTLGIKRCESNETLFSITRYKQQLHERESACELWKLSHSNLSAALHPVAKSSDNPKRGELG